MKNKKFVIIGGSAAGATLATNLRRFDDFSEIIIIEKGPDVSYANCSLPYYFSGEVESIAELEVTSVEKFKKKYQVDARTNEEVIKIHREKKSIQIKNLLTGKVYEEDYDYLILASGTSQKMPEDLVSEKSFFFKNLEDVRKLDDFIKKNKVKNITIIGNGFIGVELAESFKKANYNVNLIGSKDQVLMPFDEDIVQFIHKEMYDKGINFYLSERAQGVNDQGVVLKSGKLVKSDLIIIVIGSSPELTLAKDAGLEVGSLKGLKVDEHFKTNDDFIYAIGDGIEKKSVITGKETLLALAGPAHKEADKLSKYFYGKKEKIKGVTGAFSLRIFDLNCGSVGLNERGLEAEGIAFDYVFKKSYDKVENGKEFYSKLLFEKESGKILGAQLIGRGEISKRLDTISTVISMAGNIYDLHDNELAYSPFLSTVKDATNILASNAIKVLEGEYEKVSLKDIRSLVENKAYILDTRSQKAFEKKHLKGAVNIEISQLRARFEEIPKDQKVYIDSYNGYSILKQRGFNNLVYIECGIGEIEKHQYFKDIILEKESIFE